MPYANLERGNTTATRLKPSDAKAMVMLFGFTALHEIAAVLTEHLPPSKGRGRKSAYPMALLLAVLASARAAESLAAAVTALHDNPELWAKCAKAFSDRATMLARKRGHIAPDDVVLVPPVPPTRDQVVYVRDRIVGKPEILPALQQAFTKVAVGQARMMGNLLPDVAPDGADPSPRHVIYGDGTVIRKYSETKILTHPITKDQKTDRGRARRPETARVQHLVSNMRLDGKDEVGLNMVAMHTWTPSGRVVLATGMAIGAEQWTALELIERIHDIAGDGVHSLIYDRAVTGWSVDYLMGARRIQVISKAVGAEASTDDHRDLGLRTQAEDRARRQLAEVAGNFSSSQIALVRRDAMADMLRYQERQPLGLCVYPTTDRRFDDVRSWSRELSPHTHPVSGGECTHRLAVDDGGLFEVDDHPEEDYVVKIRHLPCASSTPFQRPDGRWGTRSVYRIPCSHGDLTYERLWEPAGHRHRPVRADKADKADKAKHRTEVDPIGWRLRPLSRPDDITTWYNAGPGERGDLRAIPADQRRFTNVFGRRSDSESFNQWYQQSLPHKKRAASLHPDAQQLDFLVAGLLNNARAWHEHRNPI